MALHRILKLLDSKRKNDCGGETVFAHYTFKQDSYLNYIKNFKKLNARKIK